MTADRLVATHQEAERTAMMALEAAQSRNKAIQDAVGGGWSIRQIARLLDLSESRVYAIVKKAPDDQNSSSS